MGHLCIVDTDTFGKTIGTGAVRARASIGGSVGTFSQQLADIFADALMVRPGDLVVPWVTGVQQGVAFHTVCRASQRAHIDSGSEFPLVIPLHESHEKYPGLSEVQTLDLWAERLLWNAIGKKSLGRGRSITHQTLLEDAELLTRLTEGGQSTQLKVPSLSVAKLKPLTIRTEPVATQTFEYLHSLPREKRLAAVRPHELTWARNGEFRTEKALEGWLAENFDTAKGASFRAALLEPAETIDWAGNYLPFGVAGASMDFVVQTTTADGGSRFHVIELKKDSLSKKNFRVYDQSSAEVCAIL